MSSKLEKLNHFKPSFNIWWIEHGERLARTADMSKIQAEFAYAAGFNYAASYVDEIQDVLTTIDGEVSTAQLDMGGKHKYSISHSGQQRIGEAMQRIKQQ